MVAPITLAAQQALHQTAVCRQMFVPGNLDCSTAISLDPQLRGVFARISVQTTGAAEGGGVRRQSREVLRFVPPGR